MIKHCSKEENDRLYPKDGELVCNHEWIHVKELNDLQYPISYYKCQLCKEEVSFLPKDQYVFTPE